MFKFDVKVDCNVDVHVHQQLPADLQAAIRLIPGMKQVLSDVNSRSIQIMATEQETLDQLKAIKDSQDATNAVLDKVSGETTGLVILSREQAALIQQLQDQIANMPTTVPSSVTDLVAQLAANATAIKDKATSIDSQVDDAAPNPTPTPDEPGEGTGEPVTG